MYVINWIMNGFKESLPGAADFEEFLSGSWRIYKYSYNWYAPIPHLNMVYIESQIY